MCIFSVTFQSWHVGIKTLRGQDQQRREKWMRENQSVDDYSPSPGNLWSILKSLTLKYRVAIKFK